MREKGKIAMSDQNPGKNTTSLGDRRTALILAVVFAIFVVVFVLLILFGAPFGNPWGKEPGPGP